MYTPPHSNPRTSPTSMISQHPPQQGQRTSPPGSSGSGDHPLFPSQFRQMHPPKSPMYRPAVLRATGGPQFRNPTTPSTSPKSLSEEYMREYKHRRADSDVASRKSFSSSSSLSDDDTSSTLNGVDVHDEIEGDFYEEAGDVNSKVTGQPGRQHWKADSSASICDAPICTNSFSFYTRRHHCRRCGNVFCHSHAQHFVPLNQHSRVHPEGFSSRVCDSCYQDVRRIRARRLNGSVSSASSMSAPTPMSSARPVMGARGSGGLKGMVGSYVGSVPRDWSWSTF